MKTFKKKGKSTKPAQWRQNSEVKAATGFAIFLMAGSNAAMAQDAPAGAAEAAEIEEVVVTGIRKSIQDSIGAKKLDSSIVEVVSAEDIGKLPDSSIAESIARLPGIAAQRTNGRAQTLSIRGLGPDFTVTTLNGREQATTNDNRTVEFDQYPSELVTQVKIYKTPDAGMAYQGIAGTTDISTVHPLSYDGRRTSVTYRREQNAQDANIPGLDDAGNRANFTYIDQFLDNTVGVAFGVAYNKSPYQAQTKEPWGYADSPTGPGERIIGGDKSGVQSSFYERLGFLGVVEYRPNDTVHLVLDAYHSDFKELQTIQRVEYGTIWANPSTPVSNPGEVIDDRVQSGTFNNVPFTVIENYNNDRDAKIDSIGLNADFTLNDNWNLNTDLSFSQVTRDDLRLESTAGNGKVGDPTFPAVPDNIPFTTGPDGRTYLNPTVNYSDYGLVMLSDPGAWGGGTRRSGFVGHPEIEDEIKAIRLTAARKFEGFLSEVSFGVNYADRTKQKDPFQSLLYLPGNVSHVAVPENYRTGVADGSFFGLANGVIGYDAIGLWNSGFWQPIDARNDPNAGDGDRVYDVTNAWTVNEKLTTVFVKFDIDTQIGELPLRGNIGVQSLTADQSALLGFTNSNIPDNTPTLDVEYREEGAKYTDILPSMNLALELPHDQKLRFGAAVTVARPRMDDLGGGSGYNVTPDSGSPTQGPNGELYYWTSNAGGNPELRPWEANTYDLSWEKYFGDNQGYFSLAAYYKDLKTYIVNETIIQDYTGFGLPSPASDYDLANVNRLGAQTAKVNGSGGWIKGFEATLSLPFATFSEALDGFGLIVSAAKNDSEIMINDEPSPVPGLSTTVINSTLYFEKAGFSARVSNRSRDEFVGEVPAFDATLTLNTVAAESILDAQIGYEFRQGAMEGLSINLQGTNLTDEPFQLTQVEQPSKDLIKYQKYGAIYSLALTYKF
ncbi:MAG TPA: TonB-dependent receptor [Steroidobacteraceae bacterium]|nr:TonB-dependent receptor [Steroidobacteraceae bacterium]